MDEKKQNNKAFTLIEILAIIVIIGTLSAVALVNFINIQNKVRIKSLSKVLSAVQTNLSQEYAKSLLFSNGDYNNAWQIISLDVCQKINKDGWLKDVTIQCEKQGNTHIIISIFYSDLTTTINFKNPATQ